MFEQRTGTKTTASGKKYPVYEKFFHGQWYQHGSKLLLQETAQPNTIFPIDECDDNKLDSIHMKCDFVESITMGIEEAPQSTQKPEQNRVFIVG